MHIWGAGLLTMFSKICVAVYKAAAVVEWPRPIIESHVLPNSAAPFCLENVRLKGERSKEGGYFSKNH